MVGRQATSLEIRVQVQVQKTDLEALQYNQGVYSSQSFFLTIRPSHSTQQLSNLLALTTPLPPQPHPQRFNSSEADAFNSSDLETSKLTVSEAMESNTGLWSSPASPTSPTAPTAAVLPTYRLKNQGRRIAQIVKLKPEFVEKYKEVHARVWPEVLKQIKDCNIEDCKCIGDVGFGVGGFGGSTALDAVCAVV